MTATEIQDRLRELGDEAVAQVMRRFFKTGPGGYGEGDTFVGLKVGPLRKLAKEYQALSLTEAEALLHSEIHEGRLLALLILVRGFARGDETQRKSIYDLYLRNTAHINNWDLVDSSAEHIVGGHLHSRSRKPLDRLARSNLVWERRISILATFHFIKKKEFADALRIAGLLLTDEHDLIHKAVGWMLREVGQRERATEENFLRVQYQRMPRTMLRYAIERFPEERRQHYLKGTLPSADPGEETRTK
jgi:3-methyladenine DNA glycosylase AlkD